MTPERIAEIEQEMSAMYSGEETVAVYVAELIDEIKQLANHVKELKKENSALLEAIDSYELSREAILDRLQ